MKIGVLFLLNKVFFLKSVNVSTLRKGEKFKICISLRGKDADFFLKNNRN